MESLSAGRFKSFKTIPATTNTNAIEVMAFVCHRYFFRHVGNTITYVTEKYRWHTHAITCIAFLSYISDEYLTLCVDMNIIFGGDSRSSVVTLRPWSPSLSLSLSARAGPWVARFTRMMTSSSGNIFRVTGPLCGKFTSHRWIPLTKASDPKLWYFLWSVPEQTVEQTIDMPVIWYAIALIMIVPRSWTPGTHLPTCVNFNRSMDKHSHAQQNMELDYSPISKLQWLPRRSVGLYK